ncbi:MAG: type IX secretion system membrane protein PorP/SprF [Flavobacteriales bacterium]|nr:type IX secretion system membrane protein PorP/SprF [Flavobacteriales bacterium]
MRYFALCALVLTGLLNTMKGQQDPSHTQYIMNKLFVNPAYAGYKELPTISAVHRTQWLGFKGAPMTQVLSYDSPLKGDELAFGATLVHDKLGPQRTTGLAGDICYRLRLSNRSSISFGAKASVDLYQAKLSELVLTSDYYGLTDQDFMQNIKALLLPNVGFGIYYNKKSHFISLSVPKMLRNKLINRTSNLYDLLNGRQEPTAFFMAGYLHKINKEFKIQPNISCKGQWGAPLSLGAHVNGIYMDQFNLGAFYYHKETAGLMFQWQINPQFRMGYSMDFPVNQLIRTSFGSHELALNYNLSTKRKRIIYPKYF